MSKDMEPARFAVESSHNLRDADKERMVGERMLSGFGHAVGSPDSVAHRVDIQVRREARPSWRTWMWFAMEAPNINEEDGSIGLKLALNVRRVGEDVLTRRYGLSEGDIAEVVGFYLRQLVRRVEQPEAVFLGKPLSDYQEVGGLDELWTECLGFYVLDVFERKSQFTEKVPS